MSSSSAHHRRPPWPLAAWLAGAAVAAAALVVCGSDDERELGFEGWLLACSGPADCDDLDCVCGLCTSRCQPVRQGEDAGGSEACDVPDGVCRAPAEVPGASCGQGTVPAGLCAGACSDASDCPSEGEGFLCQRGLCVSETVEVGCQPADCGPAPGIPNTLCPDGRTVAGPTGQCLETESGSCDWEIVSCP